MTRAGAMGLLLAFISARFGEDRPAPCGLAAGLHGRQTGNRARLAAVGQVRRVNYRCRPNLSAIAGARVRLLWVDSGQPSSQLGSHKATMGKLPKAAAPAPKHHQVHWVVDVEPSRPRRPGATSRPARRPPRRNGSWPARGCRPHAARAGLPTCPRSKRRCRRGATALPAERRRRGSPTRRFGPGRRPVPAHGASWARISPPLCAALCTLT